MGNATNRIDAGIAFNVSFLRVAPACTTLEALERAGLKIERHTETATTQA